MKNYWAAIATAELLSAAEERELAGRVADGDPEARDHLVRANLRLVIALARPFVGRGVPHEDLIAEGNLGLLRAAEGYDGRSGVRFATYATFWIRQAIRRTVISQGRLIRLPHYTVTLMAKWRRAQGELAEQFGRVPTEDEISTALGLSESKRRIAREVLHAAAMTRYEPDEGTGMPEFVASGGPAPDAGLAEAEERAYVLASLDGLDPLEAAILRLRYGIDSGGPASRAEIGRRLGRTPDWVRKSERRAMERLASGACRAGGAMAPG